MSFLPVIARELREEARRPTQHWMRLLGAATVALVLATWLLERQHGGWANAGLQLFLTLHLTMLAVIWIFVPVMTADCIARERREGTLGLLFLTPLTARGIVVAKSFVQMTKALILFLAVLPMMSLPLLMGGVAVIDILSAFTIQFCSLVLAIAAGLLASARSRVWVRALLLAEIFAVLSAVCFSLALPTGFLLTARSALWVSLTPEVWLRGAILLPTGLGMEGWSQLAQRPGMMGAWCLTLAGVFTLVVLWFLSAVILSARMVQRCRSEEPPGKRQLWFLQTFCTPMFWRSIFRGKMRRALDRNPIGWLQQYSWSARLSKWGWCFLVIAVETLWVSLDRGMNDFFDTQFWLCLLLLIGMSFNAAGSFRRERENGALELILVAPLQIHQIILGRLRGIWSQFLPAIAIVALTFFGMRHFPDWWWNSELGAWVYFIGFLSSAATLPVIGLYLSLRLQNFIVSWVLALMAGLVMPCLAITFIAYLSSRWHMPLLRDFDEAFVCMILIQAGAAAVCGILLFGNLQRREFALGGKSA